MLIKSGQEWTPQLLEDMYLHIERIATEKFGLDVYTNQLEIISSEQMLDAYASIGLPIFYPHWSFGKHFVRTLEAYQRGQMGLAYELVINSNPCISYLMEENTALMQALVIAHAAFGHNSFFKTNYLFKQWTDASGIIDYLVFAKRYVKECEEKYGKDDVEIVLDAAHALMQHGVDKYKHPEPLSAAQEEALRIERERWRQSQLNELWETIPRTKDKAATQKEERFPEEPQENLLYFIEKNAPRMETWKREILRIVRNIAQYFFPQRQTKVMNEGFATFFHYKIIHEMYNEGLIDDGAFLEFTESHTNVVTQTPYNSPHFSGVNPYALGWAMYKDIERVAMNPTEEDKIWFGTQDWVGQGDWLGAVKWAAENFKDESFIQQYLSPNVIRDFRLWVLHDDQDDPMMEVSGIHNDQGFKTVRAALSRQYNIGYQVPDIQVYNVDLWGDRSMTLRHFMVDGRPLKHDQTTETLLYLTHLWEYDVKLESVTPDGQIKGQFEAKADGEVNVDVFLEDGN